MTNNQQAVPSSIHAPTVSLAAVEKGCVDVRGGGGSGCSGRRRKWMIGEEDNVFLFCFLTEIRQEAVKG
jgi:hypothetical protein